MNEKEMKAWKIITASISPILLKLLKASQEKSSVERFVYTQAIKYVTY